MDESTSVDELKQIIRKHCEARDWDQYHDQASLSIGIITEAAELLQHFRFKSKEECQAMLKDAIKREEIEEELADTFYFVLRFAQINNIDLSEALKKKMKKNEIKYPVEKAKGSNKKYNEL